MIENVERYTRSGMCQKVQKCTKSDRLCEKIYEHRDKNDKTEFLLQTFGYFSAKKIYIFNCDIFVGTLWPFFRYSDG